MSVFCALLVKIFIFVFLSTPAEAVVAVFLDFTTQFKSGSTMCVGTVRILVGGEYYILYYIYYDTDYVLLCLY